MGAFHSSVVSCEAVHLVFVEIPKWKRKMFTCVETAHLISLIYVI